MQIRPQSTSNSAFGERKSGQRTFSKKMSHISLFIDDFEVCTFSHLIFGMLRNTGLARLWWGGALSHNPRLDDVGNGRVSTW